MMGSRQFLYPLIQSLYPYASKDKQEADEGFQQEIWNQRSLPEDEWLALPGDIWNEIFSYILFHELSRAVLACKSFYRLVKKLKEKLKEDIELIDDENKIFEIFIQTLGDPEKNNFFWKHYEKLNQKQRTSENSVSCPHIKKLLFKKELFFLSETDKLDIQKELKQITPTDELLKISVLMSIEAHKLTRNIFEYLEKYPKTYFNANGTIFNIGEVKNRSILLQYLNGFRYFQGTTLQGCWSKVIFEGIHWKDVLMIGPKNDLILYDTIFKNSIIFNLMWDRSNRVESVTFDHCFIKDTKFNEPILRRFIHFNHCSLENCKLKPSDSSDANIKIDQCNLNHVVLNNQNNACQFIINDSFFRNSRIEGLNITFLGSNKFDKNCLVVNPLLLGTLDESSRSEVVKRVGTHYLIPHLLALGTLFLLIPTLQRSILSPNEDAHSLEGDNFLMLFLVLLACCMIIPCALQKTGKWTSRFFNHPRDDTSDPSPRIQRNNNNFSNAR